MKKKLMILTVFLVCFALSGCSFRSAAGAQKEQYIVSALGFDGEDGKIRMSLECLVINTEESSEKKRTVYSGSGKTVDEAFSGIAIQRTQPIMLDHAATILIGAGLTPEQLGEILDYCKNNNEINISCTVAAGENAGELLTAETVSSIALGYDIADMIEVVTASNGMALEDRLYQIEAAKEYPQNLFYLPRIEKTGTDIRLASLSVYRDNRKITSLSPEQAKYLSLLTGRFTHGDMQLNGKKADIRKRKVSYGFSVSDGLVISAEIKLRTGFDPDNLQQGMTDFFRAMQKDTGDIFGFGNRLSEQQPENWEKIKTNYDSFFRNATLEVTVSE